jgi:hypothetical protein
LDEETQDAHNRGDAAATASQDSVLVPGGVRFLILEEHEETGHLGRTVRYFDRVILLSVSSLPILQDIASQGDRSLAYDPAVPDATVRPTTQRAD